MSALPGDEWEERTVDSLGSVRGGKRLPKGSSLVARPTGHPYIRVSDMRPGGVDLAKIRYVPGDVAPRIRAYRIFRNDIFISVAGSLGIVGRIPPELDGANLTENADRITAISCDVDYLMYSLRNEPIQREIDVIQTIGAQPKLALGRIRQFSIHLPRDRSEQRRIAGALADADALIASLERLLAKKQAIKQGMMQQLLTGRTRLPGFVEPWRSVSLGDLGTFLKGRGVKRDDVQSTGIPCIRYGELYTAFSNYTAAARSFVASSVASTALPIRYGDLLFAGSGETRDEIGVCVAYVGDVPAVAGGDIVVLRGLGYNPIFLAALTNLPAVAQLKARAGQGDAVVHISSRALASIEVCVPAKPEQDAIARVLVDVDRELDVLAKRLAKARAVKTGMMQQLLSGRVRLPVEVAA